MKINKYPDGTSYVEIPKEWEDTTREITFRINSYEEVVHLAQLCEVLIFNRVKAHIIIPCLLDAQADRRFNEFHSSGLKTLAIILEGFSNQGISFGIFHPHNPEVVESMFTNVEIIDNSIFINKVLSIIDSNNYPKILMSSDAGGFKPLVKLCDKLKWQGEIYSASKARDSKTGKLTQLVDREDFGGKDILIIDDICVYGGTFKGLAKLLRERNCGKLYLAVSHMTVQYLGEDSVTDYFDKVFTTNSKYDRYVNRFSKSNIDYETIPKNLEIIKMF